MARICPLLLRMLVVLLAFLPAGCKDEIPELIPSTRVRIVIDLALPEFSGLRFPGSVYLAKGEGYRGNGVYVVREAIDEEQFSAYDATCPRHIKPPTATVLTGTQATCPHCHTEYELLNYGQSADGNHRLQPYRTEAQGGVVHVHNP